jgi:hypothetical protein
MDIGTAKMLTAISDFIKKKGINVFSNTKEMIGLGYDFNAAGNISRPKFHGLIARIPGKATNYCLTEKGLKFLSGEPILSVTIIKKGTNDEPPHVIGHEGPEITIDKLLSGWGDYWSANGYEIKEGIIITKPTVKQTTLL